jgi:hypothetical protein
MKYLKEAELVKIHGGWEIVTIDNIQYKKLCGKDNFDPSKQLAYPKYCALTPLNPDVPWGPPGWVPEVAMTEKF